MDHTDHRNFRFIYLKIKREEGILHYMTRSKGPTGKNHRLLPHHQGLLFPRLPTSQKVNIGKMTGIQKLRHDTKILISGDVNHLDSRGLQFLKSFLYRTNG